LEPILPASFAFWLLAQFGLRQLTCQIAHPHFGVGIPPNEIGHPLGGELPARCEANERLFSTDDVNGSAPLAVAWRLRSDAIAQILNEVAGTKKSSANVVAAKLLEEDTDYLLVYRTPRRPSKSIPKTTVQRVEIASPEELYLFSTMRSQGEFTGTDWSR